MTRGLAVTLLVIPAAILAFGLVGGFFQAVTGFVAIVVPPIAAWLFSKGAGTPVTREARAPFILITATAIVLGLFTGIAASTYARFLSVAGEGGPLGSAYLRTLGTQFTTGFEDTLVPIIFGLGLGAVAIFSVLRGPRPGAAGTAPTAPAPAPAATLPPAAPTTPAANTPSPGIILNGKPLDPKQK